MDAERAQAKLVVHVVGILEVLAELLETAQEGVLLREDARGDVVEVAVKRLDIVVELVRQLLARETFLVLTFCNITLSSVGVISTPVMSSGGDGAGGAASISSLYGATSTAGTSSQRSAHIDHLCKLASEVGRSSRLQVRQDRTEGDALVLLELGEYSITRLTQNAASVSCMRTIEISAPGPSRTMPSNRWEEGSTCACIAAGSARVGKA